MARRQGHAARQGRAVSSPDAGQDRALAPDAQEPHPPRALQSSPLSREPRQPHPGRRLLRTRPDHPPRTRKDQTTDHRQPPLAASRPSRLTSKPEEPEPPFQKPAPCLKLSDDGQVNALWDPFLASAVDAFTTLHADTTCLREDRHTLGRGNLVHKRNMGE